MIVSATEKQKRVTAQSKLRMQKHRAKTKSILAKDVAYDVAMAKEPDAMELDAVLVNPNIIFFPNGRGHMTSFCNVTNSFIFLVVEILGASLT